MLPNHSPSPADAAAGSAAAVGSNSYDGLAEDCYVAKLKGVFQASLQKVKENYLQTKHILPQILLDSGLLRILILVMLFAMCRFKFMFLMTVIKFRILYLRSYSGSDPSSS
jgi:hypothetical protein